ncbi:hypothetical protein B0H19DRAFT_1081017 [Mycena capillaripes]|nr:hypothetical protein B0H19DRAFT_1081017 [Mycena capillaripes]
MQDSPEWGVQSERRRDLMTLLSFCVHLRGAGHGGKNNQLAAESESRGLDIVALPATIMHLTAYGEGIGQVDNKSVSLSNADGRESFCVDPRSANGGVCTNHHNFFQIWSEFLFGARSDSLENFISDPRRPESRTRGARVGPDGAGASFPKYMYSNVLLLGHCPFDSGSGRSIFRLQPTGSKPSLEDIEVWAGFRTARDNCRE